MKACGLWSRPVFALLHDRQPAELAAPDDERRVEQAALLQVGRADRRWAVGLGAKPPWFSGDVGVAVPAQLVLHAAGVDLHEAHAALDQPPGDQALLGEVRRTSGCRGRRAAGRAAGSLFDVERFGRGHLHAVGQLEAFRCARPAPPRRACVQAVGVELRAAGRAAPAAGRRSCPSGRVRLSIGSPCGLNAVPWIDARQEAGAPVLGVPLRHAAAERVVHHDERRQVLALACPGRRSPTSRRTGKPMRVMPVLILNSAGEWLFESVQHEWRNAILSTCLAMLRKELRDPRPALAVLGELERRLHQRPDLVGEEAGVLVEALEFLAVALGEFRLVVPGIDLAAARRS